MADWLATELKSIGVEVETRSLGREPERPHLELPPVILGRYGRDASKPTILLYGHYDVQPASLEDGWTTDPFVLTIDDEGHMAGRGSSDDKGPIMGWINALEGFLRAGVELPVNILICFEGMEETGSVGLEELIRNEANGYFKDVDAVCISDSVWLGTQRPCLTYGLRGCNFFIATISGASRDIHAGIYGGAIHEPMVDMVSVLSTLVNSRGEIKVKGINEMVKPLTSEEEVLYKEIDYTMEDVYEGLGSKTSIHDNPISSLMSR